MSVIQYLQQYLKEEYYKTDKVSGQTVQIFKNPDTNEVDILFHNEDYNDDNDSVRGVILDTTKDLYVWPSYILHESMIEHMNWFDIPYMPIVINKIQNTKYIDFAAFDYGSSLLKKSLPYDSDEGSSEDILNYIRNNPNVKSLGLRIG